MNLKIYFSHSLILQLISLRLLQDILLSCYANVYAIGQGADLFCKPIGQVAGRCSDGGSCRRLSHPVNTPISDLHVFQDERLCK